MKQPSFPRVMLLLLFALSALFFLYETGKRLRLNTPRTNAAQIRKELIRQAGNVAARLMELEAPALALLALGKNYPSDGDASMIRRALRESLDKAPESITGVGIGRPATGGRPHLIVYLARDESDDPQNGPQNSRQSGPVFFPPAGDADPENATPREMNLDARFFWRVAFSNENGDEDGARPGIVLNARLMNPSPENRWTAFVAADFSWMTGVLESLEKAGAGHAYCVTPDNTHFWLHDGGLHSGHELPSGATGATGGGAAPENARDVYDDEAKENDAFNYKADVAGAGWRLAAGSARTPFVWPRTPLWMLLGSLAALLLEWAASRGSGGNGEGERENAAGLATENGGGWLHNLLFKYRFINPEQQRADSELRVAREIQFSLVPLSLPKFSEWREFDLHAWLQPVREVGGDFYDFCRLDSNRLCFVIGDVSGKGVPAALYMAVCQTALRTLMRGAANPGELLDRVNDMLVRDNATGRYVTAAVFFVDMPSGRCQYALAGHPPPLWRHAASGVTDAVDSPRSIFVGLKGGVKYAAGEIVLSPGDTLLLYTDGATEARNTQEDDLELHGLSEMFDQAVTLDTCRDLVDNLERSIGGYVDQGKVRDDITLLAFRYWGPGGKKMAGGRSRTTTINSR